MKLSSLIVAAPFTRLNAKSWWKARSALNLRAWAPVGFFATVAYALFAPMRAGLRADWFAPLKLLIAASFVSASGLALAADVPIFQYHPTTILFPNAMASPMTYYADWDTACVAAATPACHFAGSAQICLSNARGRFKPNFGAGCEYTFTHSIVGTSQVFYQNWSYPTKWCPTGFTYQSISNRCVKAETYQDTNVCPTSNPVYASDGSKRQSEIDFSYVANGQRINLERTFFSDALSGFRSAAGWGWSLKPWSRALNVRMANTGPRIILATRDAGRTYALQADANGVWRATPYDGVEIKANAGGWLLSDTAAGEQEQYDSSGVLLQLWHASGSAFTLTYSDASTPLSIALSSGLLIQVAANQGPSLNLTYDNFGRLWSARIDGGGTATYGYDITRPAHLTSTRYADSTERRYIYDASIAPSELASLAGTTVFVGYAGVTEYNESIVSNSQVLTQLGRRNPDPLTGVIDESGIRYTTYQYDPQGRVKSASRADGVSNYSFDYATTPVQTVVTNPLGSISTRTYTTSGSQIRLTSQSQAAGSGCNASVAESGYGPNSNPFFVKDFNGHHVCYAHDLTRNVETVRVEGIAGVATGTQCNSVTGAGASLPSGSRKISTDWHPDWRRMNRLAEPRRRTTWVYNGQPDSFNGGSVATCAPATALLPDGKPVAVLCKQVEQATLDLISDEAQQAHSMSH